MLSVYRASLFSLFFSLPLAALPLLAWPALRALPQEGGIGGVGNAAACIALHCRAELTACMSDLDCARGLACAGVHANDPRGQVRCMDVFEDAALSAFSECALGRAHCIPALPADLAERAAFVAALARTDASPPTELPVASQLLSGRWSAALGLNPSFDLFPCQREDFANEPSAPGVVSARFRYRVVRDDGSLLERSGHFLLDTPNVARRHVLRLRPSPPHLNSEDEWLLLGGQLNATDPWFAMRYYGANAAWAGYGGANVFTRSGKPPSSPSALHALDAALAKGGLRRSELAVIDNTCPPIPSLSESGESQPG